MLNLVVNTLKSWKITRLGVTKADKALVDVQSRRFGLISRILYYFKIDLATNFIVYKNRIVYETGNILGFKRSTIPLRDVTSVHSGRQKPIFEAILIAAITILILRFFGSSILDIFASIFDFKPKTVYSIKPWINLVSYLNGGVLGLIYFLLVNHLYLGIIESGDQKYDIVIREFPWNKKSKNQKLADDSARVILRLLQSRPR